MLLEKSEYLFFERRIYHLETEIIMMFAQFMRSRKAGEIRTNESVDISFHSIQLDYMYMYI